MVQPNLTGKLVIAEFPNGRVVTGRCSIHIWGWITLRFRSGKVVRLTDDRALAIIEEDE